jgi:hypothetical protein
MTTPSIVPFIHSSDPPSRSELRATIFWCARWLLGGTTFLRGPIHVMIGESPEPYGGCEELMLRPKPGEEFYSAHRPPGTKDDDAVSMSKLLAAFVSEDGLRIWRCVAEKGPIAAKNVPMIVGVERSRCYVLLMDLKDRRLIADHGDGYVIADKELWGLVAGRDPANEAEEAVG